MVTVNVKPVPEVLIKLKDKSYKCSFNMIAMANIQEALGTLEGEEHITNISPAHMCALVLYAGIKANDDSSNVTVGTNGAYHTFRYSTPLHVLLLSTLKYW